MTETAPADGPDLSHEWVGAALVDLTLAKAKRVAKYQSYRADAGEKISVLDTYCKHCRLNYDDVADQACQAKIDNTHLIGGDQAHRAKRKKPVLPEDAVIVPGPRINRYGMDAYLQGYSR